MYKLHKIKQNKNVVAISLESVQSLSFTPPPAWLESRDAQHALPLTYVTSLPRDERKPT